MRMRGGGPQPAAGGGGWWCTGRRGGFCCCCCCFLKRTATCMPAHGHACRAAMLLCSRRTVARFLALVAAPRRLAQPRANAASHPLGLQRSQTAGALNRGRHPQLPAQPCRRRRWRRLPPPAANPCRGAPGVPPPTECVAPGLSASVLSEINSRSAACATGPAVSHLRPAACRAASTGDTALLLLEGAGSAARLPPAAAAAPLLQARARDSRSDERRCMVCRCVAGGAQRAQFGRPVPMCAAATCGAAACAARCQIAIPSLTIALLARQQSISPPAARGPQGKQTARLCCAAPMFPAAGCNAEIALGSPKRTAASAAAGAATRRPAGDLCRPLPQHCAAVSPCRRCSTALRQPASAAPPAPAPRPACTSGSGSGRGSSGGCSSGSSSGSHGGQGPE